MKTTPRAGDYVRTAGMTIPQYHAVVKVFIENGCRSGEYGSAFSHSDFRFVGWLSSSKGFYHTDSCDNFTGRELSLSDLLGDRQSMAEFLGAVPTIESILKDSDSTWSGEGLPPAGSTCEFKYIKSLAGVWSVCRVDFVGSSCAVITTAGNSEICVFNHDIEFRPLKSEREIAIEEMENIRKEWVKNSHSTPDLFGMLYDKGFRKVEK